MWSYSKGFLLVAALQAYKSFAWTTVKVPHAGGDVDDTPGLLTAIASVSSNTTILFEKGVTYNLFTPVTLPSFSNVEVSIQGNITYPDNITAVQSECLLFHLDLGAISSDRRTGAVTSSVSFTRPLS